MRTINVPFLMSLNHTGLEDHQGLTQRHFLRLATAVFPDYNEPLDTNGGGLLNSTQKLKKSPLDTLTTEDSQKKAVIIPMSSSTVLTGFKKGFQWCARSIFCFFTSKNTVLISIEKSYDNTNDNRHKHPIRITYSTQQI